MATVGTNQEPTGQDDDAEWRRAIERTRRRTHESPGVAGDEAVGVETVFPHPGHALRGPERAWAASASGDVRRWPTALAAGLSVAVVAAATLLWLKQDHDRVTFAKDRQLVRVEAQLARVHEQREQAMRELQDLRTRMQAQIDNLRAQRNAALVAQGSAPSASIAVTPKKLSALPKLPVKVPVSDDPLSGLNEGGKSVKTRR